MNSFVYGLEYDFIQKNGYYMVFTKENKQPFAEDDLAGLQIKMIQSNTIPRLLPIEVEEIDFDISIHYDITSKRMLAPLLREKPLTMQQYYTLFLNIISTLEESKLYMLNDQNYILKEDFIFLGKDANEVYLTYLPIPEVQNKPPMIEDLKELLLGIAGEVQGLKGSEFKNILSYIKDPQFNLSGLKELLLKLQSRSVPNRQHYSQDSDLNYESAAFSNEQGQAASQTTSSAEGRPEPKTGKNKSPSSSDDNGTDKTPLTQRSKIYLFAGTALVIAMIWKLYEIVPGTSMLYACAGLTVLAVAAVVVYFTKMKTGQPLAVANHEAAASITDTNTQKKPDASLPMYEHDEPLSQYKFSPAFEEPEISPEERSEEHYVSLQRNTSLRSNQDDTVLLGDQSDEETENQEESHKNVSKPRLEIERNGEMEQITIHGDHFTIGRNPSVVQYVEETIGVSRVHLEFVRIEGSYGLKDLGSKNGTKLNDKQMVPYKIYALKENDRITLGDIEYVYRWSDGE